MNCQCHETVIEFEKTDINVTFKENTDVEIDVSSFGGGIPYEGQYDVVPSVDFQLLPTAEKVLEDDVIVHPIPYSEVSNKFGGYTVTIGG